MGNVSLLKAVEDERRPSSRDRVVLQAKNCIPVFWWTLFEPANLAPLHLPLAGGQDLTIPGLVTHSEVACALVAQRRVLLEKWLPTELQPLVGRWLALVSSIEEPKIVLDPCELALNLDFEDLRSWILEACASFELSSDAPSVALFDGTELEYDSAVGSFIYQDARVAEACLLGFS